MKDRKIVHENPNSGVVHKKVAKFALSDIRLIMHTLLKVGMAKGCVQNAAGIAEQSRSSRAQSVEQSGTEVVESWSDHETAVLAHCLLAIAQEGRPSDVKPSSQDLGEIPSGPLPLFKL